jgi:DNA-binding SARP family transcriptional activator/tetratricopeptide (TPR) repeat protein
VVQDHLRLRLLGPLSVDGELAAPVPVGKARRVLAVLAVRGGEFVSVGSLVSALWDEAPPEHAERNVAALISRLRRALGRDRIAGNASGYRLLLDGLSVDLAEAVELVETAERELAYGHFSLAATGAEHAAKLLDADVALAGERDDPWVVQLRLTVQRWLRRARICLATAALELGSADLAVQAAEAVLAVEEIDEQAARLAMAGHQRAGRTSAALVAYRRLRGALAEQLGSDPSPQTQAVYVSVLRSERPPPPAARPAGAAAPSAAALVGREAEQAKLGELWGGAAAGSPALAVIAGEMGIGKTALIDWQAGQARRTGALVTVVGCFEAERSLYLQPLVQAVRAIAQRLRPAEIRELAGARLGTLCTLVPDLAELLGPVAYERAGPELEHGRSLDALVGFLTRLSARQPVLLVIEDAQHTGRSTIEALHLLATRWAGSRILVLLTERTAQDAPVTAPLREVAAAWLEPAPLSPEQVAALVARSGAQTDLATLYSWTGGSPLFVTELLRHPPGSATPRVPGSLHAAVAERIARVGEQAEELLGVGAVLGTAFALDTVAALAGLDAEEVARRAGRALRARLLHSDGDGFRFANDIVRQVAYESVPEPVRISRHRRAARLLRDRPEAAAGQHAAAGDWSAAARAWVAAAWTAHLAFANGEAVQLLGHAVTAAREAGEKALLADVLLRRGRAFCELGRHEAARADLEAALELARSLDDPALEARALEQLGWAALYARDAMHAVDFAEQATALAESAAAAPGALPSATLLLGRVRHWDGEYARAEAAYQHVLAAASGESSTAALALAYRGALLQHQDRFAEARSVLARAAVLCRRTGEFRPMLQTLFFTALARGDCGDFAGALRALGNARRLIDAEKVGFYRAGIETTTSWLLQELGQVHRAKEHALLAVELARRGGGALELEQELHALLAVADAELLLGDEDAAGAAVEAAEPMLRRSLPFRPRAAMRLLEMRSRWRPELAEELYDQARRYSSRKYEALALRALGRPERARRLALATGSDLLIGQLGTTAERRAAASRIGASLPADLRASFAAAGRLNVAAPRTPLG